MTHGFFFFFFAIPFFPLIKLASQSGKTEVNKALPQDVAGDPLFEKIIMRALLLTTLFLK